MLGGTVTRFAAGSVDHESGELSRMMRMFLSLLLGRDKFPYYFFRAYIAGVPGCAVLFDSIATIDWSQHLRLQISEITRTRFHACQQEH